MTDSFHHDFETFSEADIAKVGAYRYATDPSTTVLMLSYGRKGQPVSLWEPHREDIPPELESWLADPNIILHAFNAQFERLIWRHVLGYDIPRERFRCTMVKAYGLGFQGSLGEVQDQIGFRPGKRKLKEGRKLIQRFCKPQPAGRKVKYWSWMNDPEGWERLRQYCIQDTIAETELDMWLNRYSPISDTEWTLYHLDQKINDAGVPIDINYANNALKMRDQAKKKIKEELIRETGLANPLSNAQMRLWLAEHGVYTPNMRADTLPQISAREYQHIVDLYSLGNSTASTKYTAFIRSAVDDTAKGMFQFAGASRTRRWAGRLVQLQNLKRGNLTLEQLEAIEDGCFDCLSLMGQPMEQLALGVRSTICSPDDRMLNVSDLSSIESRILGWIAKCGRINQLFADHKDTYKDFATELFNVPYEEVTKEQRTFAKPPVLGCGYFLGGKGLVAYAAGMGVNMSLKEATQAVYAFRDSYPEVTYFWEFVIGAIRNLLVHGTETRTALLDFTLSKDGSFLFITLPSGRSLSYYMPVWKVVDVRFGEEVKQIPSFTYMGFNRYTMKWGRVAAHKGLITENIIQAIARDILAVWLMRADRAGFDIRLHVHDEVGTLERGDRLKELNSLITHPIPWAPGLLLEAEGYTSKRYRKG